MTTKTKKVILTHVIIIISIVFVSFVVGISSEFIPYNKTVYFYDVSVGDFKYSSYTAEKWISDFNLEAKVEIYDNLKGINPKGLESLSKSFFVANSRVKLVRRIVGDNRGRNFLIKSSFYILFYTYPLYLLILSIIWGIKKLEKENLLKKFVFYLVLIILACVIFQVSSCAGYKIRHDLKRYR